MFVQENIEKLKRHWTDKYVIVDGRRPELRRFDGYTGQVKTVNMNGRALVQFDAWSNIGWYDIDCAYLTEVPKPEPGAARRAAETEKPAAKAAPAKAAPAKAQAGAPAAAPPAAKPGGRMSVAEMLAAARANKPAAAGAAAASSASTQGTTESPPAAAKPAAAKPTPEAAAPTTTAPVLEPGKRPSVAEMLAYCRAHDSSA